MARINVKVPTLEYHLYAYICRKNDKLYSVGIHNTYIYCILIMQVSGGIFLEGRGSGGTNATVSRSDF